MVIISYLNSKLHYQFLNKIYIQEDIFNLRKAFFSLTMAGFPEIENIITVAPPPVWTAEPNAAAVQNKISALSFFTARD